MKYFIILTSLLFCLDATGQVKDIDSLDLVKLIEQKIDTMRSQYNVPGAVISIIKNGRLFYTAGIGHENIEDDIMVDPRRSQFRVASITKTFTAIAIMQLVEQGKLDLHEDIRTYLPADEYPWHAPYSFTIHHLLTHTAGMENSSYRASKASVEARSLDIFIKTSICDQVFKPGELFFYSNRGYGILGLLIEKLSGQKYEDYIEEHILLPMGMHHSTLYQHTTDHPIDRPVQPYFWDGEFKKRERRFLVNPAASTLNTTGTDMARFMMTMLDSAQVGDRSIVSKESFELLTASHFAVPTEFESMAYGMMIEMQGGFKGYNHGGGIDGFGSYYIFFSELDLGFFMSESGGEENAGYCFNVIYSVLRELLESREKKATDPIPTDLAISQAERYEGRYQLATVTRSTFERGEMIFGLREPIIKHIGGGTITFAGDEYTPLDEDTYQQKDGRKTIGFKTNEHGEATQLSERLYWTFEKIPWIQSAVALRIGLGISLFGILCGLIIRPLYLFKTKNISLRWKSILTPSVSLLIGGFALLILGNALNINLTNGTAPIYKIGLWMTTIGAVVFAFYPVELLGKIKSLSSSDKFWSMTNACLIILLLVCYWRINVIGLNYY